MFRSTTLVAATMGMDLIEAAAQTDNRAPIAIMQRCVLISVAPGAVFAPARQRDELCEQYQICRSSLPGKPLT
jgi:ribosomal-protein-alanine N-acetyltransferase